MLDVPLNTSLVGEFCVPGVEIMTSDFGNSLLALLQFMNHQVVAFWAFLRARVFWLWYQSCVAVVA